MLHGAGERSCNTARFAISSASKPHATLAAHKALCCARPTGRRGGLLARALWPQADGHAVPESARVLEGKGTMVPLWVTQ